MPDLMNCSYASNANWSDLDVIKSGADLESILSAGNSIFANQVVGFANYPVEAALKPLNDMALLQGLLRGSDKNLPTILKKHYGQFDKKYLHPNELE